MFAKLTAVLADAKVPVGVHLPYHVCCPAVAQISLRAMMCCSVNDACCFGGKLFLFLSNSFDVSPHLVVGRSLLPMASGAQKQRTGMGGLL